MDGRGAAGLPRNARGRGACGYRRYFFKRNGRTIPARGQYTGARGGSYRHDYGRRGVGLPSANTSLTNIFFRPQFHASPNDFQQQVDSITIETPLSCPGWRLYFYKEPYKADSEISKRITLMETHFSKYQVNYDLLDIQAKGYFTLSVQEMCQDSELIGEWLTLIEDFSLHPMRTMAILSIAMHSLTTSAALNAPASQQVCAKDHYAPTIIKPRKIFVRPIGILPEKAMRLIGNMEVDQLYCVRGVVTAIGGVDATASWIAYRCTKCNQELALKQKGFLTPRPYSCKRESCQANAGFVELRASPFTRITPKQMIRLTEARLDILIDTEPNSVLNVELSNDLVDTIHLGQELVVTGILKIRPLREESEYDMYSDFAAQIDIFMKASSIVDAKFVNNPFTPKDIEAISMINSEANSFKLLVHSLAPEVHGFEMAKAGVLLSIMGGSGSQIHDEGEINVLLAGDPGVGKSNILQMCAKVSQKAAIVQSKLGASSTSRKVTVSIKGRTNCVIESGGLLTAKHGHCSVDDIDGLSSQLEGLLNVLQSHNITMAFPSAFCAFSTPTSIIATANSLRGHYDQSKLLTENIRILPQLLNEFHLIFVLLDKPSKDMDTSLTEHIRSLHAGHKKNSMIAAKYNQRIKRNDSMHISFEYDKMESEYNLAARLKLSALDDAGMDLLPGILVKRFIAYCRRQVKPLFLPEASDKLKDFYMELRLQSEYAQYSISSRYALSVCFTI